MSPVLTWLTDPTPLWGDACRAPAGEGGLTASSPQNAPGEGQDNAHRIVVVTGVSGAGKGSILNHLEDLGYEVVDNPPLDLLVALAERTDKPLAVGVDVRSRGFEPHRLLEALSALRMRHWVVQIVFATADNDVILRRYTATRRRHPLALGGSIEPVLERERDMLAPLRHKADLVIDTTDLPLPELRRLVNTRFGVKGARGGLGVVVMSFAYPAGLPHEADMVFDVRFLANPHYEPTLRAATGLEGRVSDHVQADGHFREFYEAVERLVNIVLPRFVAEGKKYLTIAFGCSGGQHRSVTVAEKLAADLAQAISAQRQAGVGGAIGVDSIMVVHRELARRGLTTWRWALPPEQVQAVQALTP
ncbi:RNase adapter RapZ [Formicincola oecophyllae]|uniref:RNase adapter RapZ n=1 Tax=Formicincola oecophyllae TaxID=2558361 RepID=A0A4Y6UB81_9PROT|nr:RNase adapter RapZ [Formicincola oecophyllae]QDH13651.1 RNase adapter RapZ [Formicincola oecophyllae]